MTNNDDVRLHLSHEALTQDMLDQAVQDLQRVREAGLTEEADRLSNVLLLFKQEMIRQAQQVATPARGRSNA